MGNILGNETIIPDRKKPTLLMSCVLNLTNTILISVVSAVSHRVEWWRQSIHVPS